MAKQTIKWYKITESEQVQNIPENISAVHVLIPIDEKFIPRVFAKCKNIKHFFVDEAKFVTDDNIRFLAENAELLSLKLTNISITDEGLKYLSSLSSLEELELKPVFTRIHSKGYACLAKLKNLKKLIFCYAEMPNFALKPIEKLEQLKHLEIESNKELYNGIIRIANIKSLEYLSLNCRKLSKYTYSMFDQAHKLKKINIGKNCNITYEECYFLQKNLKAKIYFDNKPLRDQLISEDDLEVLWEGWLNTEPEKKESFISNLPPIDCWATDLSKFLNKRFSKLDIKTLEIEAKHALMFIKSESLSCYSKELNDIQTDMQVELLVSIQNPAQRKEIYLYITEKMFKYRWTYNYEWFNSILANEKNEQVYWEVLMSYDKEMGVFPLINMHIIDIVRAKVKSTWDAGKMKKLRSVAAKLKEQSQCPVCDKQLTIWEMGDERCKACWEKSFDDWNERFEDMDREEDDEQILE